MSASLQLLTGDGTLEEQSLHAFLTDNGADQWNRHYNVVAVMGPQSSGKSTLMNHVFGTDFREMDHERGRSQTTRGVWLARAKKPDSNRSDASNPHSQKPILVMDLEGTDGRERGEEDTAFEKQTALFAMASADVLMVNMWCNDLGREVASGKPLLKVVFQVNLKLFSPEKKTTLLFVIRDKSRTPEERLLQTLTEDLKRIWDGITKPEHHVDSVFTDFFDLKFVALSHYEHAHDNFLAGCESLRSKFFDSSGSDNSSINPPVVPASGLTVSLREAWRAIQENRDLDLPKHGVMVATVRCEEIVNEIMEQLMSENTVKGLVETAESSDPGSGSVGLGVKIHSVIDQALTKYGEEAKFFDKDIASAKKTQLITQLRKKLSPAILTRLRKVSGHVLKKVQGSLGSVGKGPGGFAQVSASSKSDADESWSAAVKDASPDNSSENSIEDDAVVAAVETTSEAFQKDLALLLNTARTEGITKIITTSEKTMERSITGAITNALDEGSNDLWETINDTVELQTKKHVTQVTATLNEYDLTQEELKGLTETANSKVFEAADAKIRDSTSITNVTNLMKSAFSKKFSKDSRGLPKVWKANDNVASVNRSAQLEAARVLALVSVCRLRNVSGDGSMSKQSAEAAASSHANIESSIVDAFVPDAVDTDENGDVVNTPVTKKGKFPTEWAGEDVSDVLLDPGQCREAWKRFESDVQYAISQAQAACAAAKRGGNQNAPAWMYVALLVTGMDEAFWLLRNPITLLLLVMLGLFLRAVYQRMDVETAMRMGFVPGIMFLATRVVPAIVAVLTKLMEEGKAAHGLNHGSGSDGGQHMSTSGYTPSSPEVRRAGGDGARVAPAVSADGVKQRRGAMMYPGE